MHARSQISTVVDGNDKKMKLNKFKFWLKECTVLKDFSSFVQYDEH